MGLSKLLNGFFFVICISHLHDDIICVWLVDNLEVLHRRLQRISMKLYISGKLILKSFSFALLYNTLYLCHSSMEIQHITLGLVVPHWGLKYRPYPIPYMYKVSPKKGPNRKFEGYVQKLDLWGKAAQSGLKWPKMAQTSQKIPCMDQSGPNI